MATEKVVTLFEKQALVSQSRKISPASLSQARRAKGLSQSDLARKVGLTRQSISSFESGARFPSGENLLRISNVLEVPSSFFMSEPFPSHSILTPRTFRAFGSSTVRRYDQCVALTEWISMVANYLGSFINYPSIDLPSLTSAATLSEYSNEDIEVIAEGLRESWGLKDGPIGNITSLVESKGVIVAKLPIADSKVNALSFWGDKQPFIAIGSSETTACRRRFDIAHELGHLVLHNHITEQDLRDKELNKRIENEANRFAGAFLLPRTSYPREVFSSKLSYFLPLKERWGVSVAAQIFRCANLAVFDETQVLNARKQLSYYKWRMREPLDDELEIENPTIFRKAVRLISDNTPGFMDQMISELKIGSAYLTSICGIEFKEFQHRENVMRLDLKKG